MRMIKQIASAAFALALASSTALAGTSTIAVTPGSGTTYQIGTNGSGNGFGYFGICDGAACANLASVNPAGTSGTNGLAVQGLAGGVPILGSGSYFYNVASSVLTRPANTTQYGANETVCLLTATTVCAPLTIPIAAANAGKGLINRVTLLKSGSSATNASFTIWFFSAAPGTASPSQFDATAYAGPRAADMPNYIGNAACATGVATSDSSAQVWYDCTLSNPNTGGALDFQALTGSTNINALISVTAAYTPASAETFQAFVSGIY